MIVKMSKIEIAGLKEALGELLGLLREEGIFHIETETVGFIEKAEEEYISTFTMDQKTLTEKLLLEDLRLKIEELFSYLPEVSSRKSYIEPENIVDTIRQLLPSHIRYCEELKKKKELLQNELSEFERYRIFLDAIEPVIGSLQKTEKGSPEAQKTFWGESVIAFTGITIKEPEAIPHIRKLLFKITEGRYELFTRSASDGTIAGIIVAEKDLSEMIRKTLSDERIPEVSSPPAIERLDFAERIRFVKEKISQISETLKSLDQQLRRFALRWKPLYDKTIEWIDDRLSIMKATTHVFETRMCFIIHGWMPREAVNELSRKINERFHGTVTLLEKEIIEEDLDRVPIILKNPPYFQPFEVMVRILPLPRYSSFDPTPFIGIFFPVLFGMILGDAGYGVILFFASLFLMKRFREKKTIKDISKILLICSVYSIFFGILYGEFLGGFGHIVFGMEPICLERRTAVIPMLYFTTAVGLFHVLIGFSLGVIGAIKKKAKREALSKLLDIFLILSVVVAIIAFCGIIPEKFALPVFILSVVVFLVLLITGGLLAPLEFVKTIGNIISYARIMAIGLTSVLLAFVANRLAGMTGNVIAGAIVAVLLHGLNIIIGVFSPAIHSIRLHYVEFFSKFIETGGRRFEPFKKS